MLHVGKLVHTKYTNNGVANKTYVQRKFTASSAYIHFNQSDEVLCEFGLFVYEHLNRFDSKMAFLRA